jgi:uncharacterized protein (TIGR02391 family)
MSEEQHLRMSFDPHTIEHLGVKMYSQIPNAIAELVANAYDADAKNVYINLYDDGENKSIEVTDDGVGMTFDDVNQQFLRIGRKRRKEEGKTSPSGKRKVTGRKGLGKLAFFGLGNVIKIETLKKGKKEKVKFTLDWEEITSTYGTEYKPDFKVEECNVSEHGTHIKLNDLKRKTPFSPSYKKQLAVSLSKLFNLFDNTFKVYVTYNDDEPFLIDNKLKFRNIEPQFEWEFPEFCSLVDHEYSEQNNINGKIISTEKPLNPGYRGITLFANGRLINTPEFFGVSESSHGFSYLTGWLEVDFVDDWNEDVISTDRQSIDWNLERTENLREFLKKTMSELERQWRDERKKKSQEQIEEKTEIKISDWYEKLPKEILPDIKSVVDTIKDESELDSSSKSDVVRRIHSLVPEYPYYHWRHLHQEIQDASKESYKNEDYYKAFIEAIKRYINEVRYISGSQNSSDRSMMGEVFGRDGRTLAVSKKYKRSDGRDFNFDTKESIEEGQKLLSMGMVAGGRNPVSHEEIVELRESGLFSEKDCLDALSLLSHLFRRLEKAELEGNN